MAKRRPGERPSSCSSPVSWCMKSSPRLITTSTHMLTLFLPLLGTWYFGSLVGSGLAVLAYVDYAIHQAVNTPGYLSNPAPLC
jgi:hypothetical protein